MNLPHYLKWIRAQGQQYFTLTQLMADLGISKTAALAAIYRAKTQNDIISPSDGLYVIVPPEHQQMGSIPAEDLIVILMKHLKVEYYVSLLSAAEYYGAAHQKSAYFQVISTKRIKHPLKFGRIAIDIIYKKSITGLPIQDRVVAAGYLKAASPELVVLDLFAYTYKSGGLNHIATVLSELIEAVDSDKLLELAEFSGEKAWLQRFGYILSQIDTMDEEKTNSVLNKVAEYLRGKIKTFVPLVREVPTKGSPRVEKWGIIANATVESDL